jgi:hypothetical protein
VFIDIQRWLENCTKDRIACNSEIADDESWYPTKLLDLTSPDGSVEIAETREILTMGSYMTLSHCCGVTKLPKSTRWSLKESKTRLLKLTKAFEDAIDLARKLKFKYIWIDGLCIVQEEPED